MKNPFTYLYHIYKVRKTLKEIGISTKHNFFKRKTLNEVLTELSSKWESLDENQHDNISKVIAGKRHQMFFKEYVSEYINVGKDKK